ncbi:tetratricopeptide repeat protein [Syntrophobacter fumaroxidans]|uniref:Sel1 domain protein repeat-containing protein n=1 Tax=Syntrophobacter fumaroxidans (strain DSM 10017 / MPOB) TaxID=335543 RepID=A0LLE5_SYNFM|nr:tetratricopeptide repeat protein [Syntrophobacter fumaroxidans]ABK18247.1 Sel1 domain protein repeat-containing protein [Syntrophobacter fumaroxidans MPOB]
MLECRGRRFIAALLFLICVPVLLIEPGQGLSMPDSGENDAERVKAVEARAEKGEPSAQFRLGEMYEYGEGVPENAALAFQWYSVSAEQGYAEAQYALGACYELGEGTDKNEMLAFQWYGKAAEQGHAQAQFEVGSRYYAGEGVRKDYAEALKWFERASSKGVRRAAHRMASLLATCPDGQSRDGKRAVAIMVDLTWTDPDSPAYLDTLAEAHAETGRFDEAVYVMDRLIEDYCRCMTEAKRKEYERKRGSYRESKPWRKD